MRARLINMKPELRKTLQVYLWQIFPVESITISTTGRKYPHETKWINCKMKDKSIRFLWYEVELLNSEQKDERIVATKADSSTEAGKINNQ
jgi:hypothetical protein